MDATTRDLIIDRLVSRLHELDETIELLDWKLSDETTWSSEDVCLVRGMRASRIEVGELLEELLEVSGYYAGSE